jgi:hypothetical protein
MNSSYVFDKNNHHVYADVSSYELGTGYGYTNGGATMSGVSVSEDDTNCKCTTTWNNVSWTASGGSIGPTVGAIVIDTTASNSPIVGYIDFGGAQTQAAGGVLTVASPEVDAL